MTAMKFSEDHEWVRPQGDGTAVVGISEYAQAQLGDLVYVELPEVGRELARGEEAATVESVKAAGEVKAAVSGVVVAVNEALVEEPDKINVAATGDGWIYRLRLTDPGELDALMDEAAYREFLDGL